MKYVFADLLSDLQANTIIERTPDTPISFSLSGSLRDEAAKMTYSTHQMLDHLWRSAQFDARDTLDLSHNAIPDGEMAAFLRHFVTDRRRLPSIDLSHNPVGAQCADALSACLSMERDVLKQTDNVRLLPPRFVMMFDTLLDAATLAQFSPLSIGRPDTPMLLPVPDRVATLAAERLLLDAAHPTSSSTTYAKLGATIWAGFVHPTISDDDGRRFAEIRMRSSAAGLATIVTDGFYTLAMRYLFDTYHMDSFSLANIRDLSVLRAALPFHTAHVELSHVAEVDKDHLDTTMAAFARTLPALQCITYVDPTQPDQTRLMDVGNGRRLQAVRQIKPSTVLHEGNLYGALMMDAHHLRVWLADPTTPIALHRIHVETLPLTRLMAALSLQSNAERLSLAHLTISADGLQTLLEALPPAFSLCVKRIDLRSSGLVATEIWQMLSRFPYISFEYDVQHAPLTRRLRLDHLSAGGKSTLKTVTTNDLSFRAVVAAHTKTRELLRRRVDEEVTLHVHDTMTDVQLAEHMTTYLEAYGRLPAVVNLTNTAASTAVAAMLAEYVHGIIQMEHLAETKESRALLPVFRTAVYLANTPMPLSVLDQIPRHRSLTLFPRHIPMSPPAATLNNIVLSSATIVPYIEGGGTDAAAFRWTACDTLPSAWPGMFSLPTMYATYFRILARRAHPPLRAFALVDRTCSTMRLCDLVEVFVQHMVGVEYVLLEEPRKWDVDLVIRHRASDEINDVMAGRMLYRAIVLMSGAMPALQQIDVVPYKKRLRPAVERYLRHLNQHVLSAYSLNVSYVGKRPAFVGFAHGVVHGRVRPNVDTVLAYSDSVHLPFAAADIVTLMARRGHGQQDLSLAMRAADVDDNILMALYLSAVPPLSNVDFSGTSVTMTGIKLIADHPEVSSVLRTMHFSDIPHLTRLKQMSTRPHLFGGISASLAPSARTVERMRLAEHLIIGAPPTLATKRLLEEEMPPVQEIETGDDLLSFLQRVKLILRKVVFIEPISSTTTMRVADTLYDWRHLSDTMQFTGRTAALWNDVPPLLFVSFFRQAHLDAVVHRLVFDPELSVQPTLMLDLYTLPGYLEFVVQDDSALDDAFFARQYLMHFNSTHTLVIYVDHDQEMRPSNDGLLVLRRDEKNLELDVGGAMPGTAMQRHIPYLLSNVEDGLLYLRGAPLSLLLDVLAAPVRFTNVHFLAMTQCSIDDTTPYATLLTPEHLLRVFPALRNVVLQLRVESLEFTRHMASSFNRFRRPGAHATLQWTNTTMGSMLTDASGMALTSEQRPAHFHLWPSDGILRPLFVLDDLHYDTWEAINHALDANFSNVHVLDLSAQQGVAFSIFMGRPERYAFVDTYVLYTVDGMPDEFWHEMEHVLRLRKSMPTVLLISEAQRMHLQNSHPVLLSFAAASIVVTAETVATPALTSVEHVLIDEPTAMLLDDGMDEDAVSVRNDHALSTWGVLRSDDVHAGSAEEIVLPLPSPDARAAWSDADIVAMDDSFRAFSHLVLDALATQHWPQPYAYVQFDRPRVLSLSHAVADVPPLHVLREAPNVFQAVWNKSSETQQFLNASGVGVAVPPNQIALLEQDITLLRGAASVLLLALQVTLHVHEGPAMPQRDAEELLRPVNEWTAEIVLHYMERSDVFGKMHAIRRAPAVPTLPVTPMPAIPREVFPAPPAAPSTESVPPASIPWGARLDEALRDLILFLQEPTHNAAMTPYVHWEGAIAKAVQVGFYLGGAVHYRIIALTGDIPNIAKRVRGFAAKIKKRREHSIGFQAREKDGAFILSIRNPSEKNDIGNQVTFAAFEIAAISTITLVRDLDPSELYPYADGAAPKVQPIPMEVEPLEVVLPEKIIVPEKIITEKKEIIEKEKEKKEIIEKKKKKITFQGGPSFLERHGYVYDGFLGYGVSGYVVRVIHVESQQAYAVKLFGTKTAFTHETLIYTELGKATRESAKPYVLGLVKKFLFPAALKMTEVIGAIESMVAPFPTEVHGATVLELMDGNLFDEKPVSSLHHATFILRLKYEDAMRSAFLTWLEDAHAAFRSAAILHRDLARRNVLFRWNETDDSVTYRIGDFGLSIFGDPDKNELVDKIDDEWNALMRRVTDWTHPSDADLFSTIYHHKKGAVSYDAVKNQLWVAEFQDAAVALTVYVNLHLQPSPMWTDVAVDRLSLQFDVTKHRLSIRSSPSSSVNGDFEDIGEVRKYRILHAVAGAAPSSSSESAESGSESAESAPMPSSVAAAADMDALRSFLLRADEKRAPLIRVAAGEVPVVRVGFYDIDANLFEFMTLSFPHLNDANRNTAKNRQSTVHEYFSKRVPTDIVYRNVALSSDGAEWTITLGKVGGAAYLDKTFSFAAADLHIDTSKTSESDFVRRNQRYPYLVTDTLEAAGYTFERVLGSGQESIVIAARDSKHDNRPVVVKMFRDSAEFPPYRRPSFLDPSVEMRNFYETENDAYRAITELEDFAPLRKHALLYYGGAPLQPMLANKFVGQPVDPKSNVIIVGYIVVGPMDNDLNYDMKVVRSDFDALFAIASQHVDQLLQFYDTLHDIFLQLNLAHLDLQLYNLFYRRLPDGTFEFRIGDFATLRYASGKKEQEEEWNTLRSKIDRAFTSSRMFSYGSDVENGTLLYSRDTQTMQLDYATERTIHRVYFYPLELSASFSNASGTPIRLESNIVKRTMEIAYTEVDGLAKILTLTEDDIKEARVYAFSMPTELALRESAAAEVTTKGGRVAVYKPAGGKYSTAHYNAPLRALNTLLTNNRAVWNVVFGTGADAPSTLIIHVNDVPLVTIEGLAANDVAQLIKQSFLSIESILVLHAVSTYRVDVEMRIVKPDKKKRRIRFHLGVPSMPLLRVTLDREALDRVVQEAEQKQQSSVVPLEMPGRPTVFFHAVEAKERGEAKLMGDRTYIKYKAELQTTGGKLLRDVFGGDRLFAIDRVLLAINNTIVTDEAQIANANLVVILATELDLEDQRMDDRTYAFVVYNFYRIPAKRTAEERVEIKQSRFFWISHEPKNERYINVAHYEFLYRTALRAPMLFLDFERIREPSARAGSMNFYESSQSPENDFFDLNVWLDSEKPVVFLAIPNPMPLPTYKMAVLRPSSPEAAALDSGQKAHVAAEFNRLFTQISLLIAGAETSMAGAVEEVTEEEPLDDAWMADSEEEEDDVEMEKDRAFIVEDTAVETAESVPHQVDAARLLTPTELLALPATSQNERDQSATLALFSGSFTLMGMEYSAEVDSLSFTQAIASTEFRIVLNPVYLHATVPTFAVIAPNIHYGTDVLAILASARFNDGQIRVSIVADRGVWRVAVQVDDTWSDIRVFCNATLARFRIKWERESSEKEKKTDMDTSDKDDDTPDFMATEAGLLLMVSLLPSRQQAEALLLECTGEECTKRLLRYFSVTSYFEQVHPGEFTSVDEVIGVMERTGLLNYAFYDSFFFSEEFLEVVMQGVETYVEDHTNASNLNVMMAITLLLMIINEYVETHEAIENKYTTEVREEFRKSYALLFPVTFTYVELEHLVETYGINYTPRPPSQSVPTNSLLSNYPLRGIEVADVVEPMSSTGGTVNVHMVTLQLSATSA